MNTIPSLIATKPNKLFTTVLIVDDSETDRRTYSRHLNSDVTTKYQILEAQTLQEALELWQCHDLDLVLVDFNLPDGDGLEFLEALRKDYPEAKLPVIMVTGQGDERTAVRAMKKGAIDYLVKQDITQVSLCHSIHSLLDIRTLNRKITRLQNQEALIARVALHIRQSLDLETVYQTIVQDVRTFLNADRTIIYKFNSDMSGEIVAESVFSPWQSCLQNQVVDTCFQENMGGLYQEGKIFAASDIYTANLSQCHLQLLESFQVRANLVVPILLPNEDLYNDQFGIQPLWGLLVVHQCSSPRVWKSADISLMQQLSVQLAIAIQQAELYKNLQNLNASLEQKIEERTKELATNEQKFRAIFNNTFQFTGLLTTTGILLEANQTALNFGGIQLDDVINRPFWETYWWTISPATQNQLKQAIARAAQGEFIRYEVDVFGAGNQIATIDFSLRPFQNELGQVVMLIAEGRNITAAKRSEIIYQQVEQALQENQILLQLIMDTLPISIFWKDRNSHYLGCNKQLLLDAGLSFIEAIVGKTDFDMPWQEQAPLYQADDRIVIESGQPKFNIEEPFTKTGNISRWLRTNKMPLKDANGEVIGVLCSYEDMTEQKEIERELKASEQRYATLVASAPVGIYRTDAAGNCLYVNNQWCDYTGLTPEAAIREGWKTALHPEDIDIVEAQWHHLVETGENFSLEYRFVRPDGEEIWVFGQAVPEKDAEGIVTGYVGTITNITNRKQAEADLQRSEQLYSALVNNFPNGAVLLFDHDLRYIVVGGLGLAESGLSKQQLEGKTIWEVFPTEVCEIIAPSFRQALAGVANIGEVPYGDRLYITHHLPVRDDQGNVIAGMTMTQDITERKQYENALKESEEKFRQFAENSRGVMLVRQIDSGELLYANPAYQEIWGQTCESLYKNPDSWMAFLHPDDHEQINVAYQATKKTGFFNQEYRIIRSDGTIRWIWGRCFPIRDGSGKIYRIGSIAEDITERKATEQERDSLLQVLEQQNQTLEAQVSQRTAELQESEKRFRNLVETSSDWIWEVNKDGIYTYSSPQIINVLGYSSEEVLGKTPFDFMPPAEAARISKEFTKFVSNQASFQCLENTNRHKDGRLIILETSGVPIIDENGQFHGYRGIDRDITPRKQAEIALWRNELRFQRIADNVPGVMYQYLLHPDGTYEFIYVSDRCREFYELEPATIIEDANNLFNLVHPDDIPSMYESIAHSAHTLEQWSWEGRVITPSGRLKWLQGISQPQKQANGDILWDGLILDISERKQIEVERKQIEIALLNISDRLNLAIKSAQIGIWDWDIVNDHLVWDDRMFQLYGVYPSDFPGAYQAWEAGLHPDDLVFSRTAIQQAIEGKVDFEPEFRVVCPDGTIKFIKAYAIIQRDNQGQAQRMIGINFDITERRREELENKRLKERLEFVLSASPAIIYTCQTFGNFKTTFISNNVQNILGYTAETWMSEPNFWLNHIHPEDLPQIFTKLSLLEAQEYHVHQYRFLHQDGNYRWLEDEFRLVRDDMGNITEIIGYVVDISQQQAVLRERELVEAEILRSRDLREAIFNESADALFLVDIETVRTLDCNKRAVEMFTATNKHDLIGIEGHELQKQQFTPEELKIINNDIESQGVWSRELEYKTFKGELFWGSLAAKQITVAGQKMNLVRVTDISQRKLAETQLQETNKQLAASNQELARATRLKDEFLANMSHELRTPLSAILGISEGLQDQVFGLINERQRRSLQTIERSGTHLLALINDILDLSKIEAGQVELDCTSVPIGQLCQSSLSFIKQQAFQKRIQLHVKIQPHLPDLLVDERRIRQVLINLLSNAVKFTPEGGSITLAVSREEHPPESKITHLRDFIRIAVIDTGIGIAQENLHKLFQPFVQIDSSLSRKYAGTGLGLSLVKRIVEMHGGEVSVTSQLGLGSHFMIDLPCVNIFTFTSKSGNQGQSDLVAVLNDTAQVSPLILLAEDNEASILTFSNYLEAKGYRLILAKNGEEAIEMNKLHCPDLILMDIQMPKMDGLEAIRQIRLNSDLTNLPIIALTALAMAGDQEKCLAAGANKYLSKPLKLKLLVNTIQQLLD
jgi:PAS domain S-box-containing protein